MDIILPKLPTATICSMCFLHKTLRMLVHTYLTLLKLCFELKRSPFGRLMYI